MGVAGRGEAAGEGARRKNPLSSGGGGVGKPGDSSALALGAVPLPLSFIALTEVGEEDDGVRHPPNKLLK